ncbi:rhodanese domain-containing protein CG4456-like [Panulirus ornatus]|uniref:rhodanese domain-containing protein CG4456-like n=1 Tax=Panulirus ornatus TaxID=150431 RepID=UPI003A85082A
MPPRSCVSTCAMAANMDYTGVHFAVLLFLTVVVTVLSLPQGSGQPPEINPELNTTTTATTGSTPPTAAPAVFTVTSSNSCRKPGVKYPIGIAYEELRQALEADTVLLIDVRNRWELEETGRLPRSVNLPLPEIEEAIKLSEDEFMRKYGFPKPMPEATNVVLTCRSGRRIQVAWKKLEPLGYCNVRLYFGSYLDWKARNGPLIPLHRGS